MVNKLANSEQFDHLIKRHPCFTNEKHFNYGRIHLPVSPDCNIQCLFCKRGFNKWEKRPGISRALLTPDEAVEKVSRALQLCPQLTVAGIAGPGDTLATDHALAVFEVLHTKFPNLINCLSTNGLLLADKAERIINAGVKTVTVTVNAVDNDILQQICSYIVYNGQHITGVQAARLLISAQIEGIRKVSASGVVVKINTVLIPGINDYHIGEVAKVTSNCGASLINIIPLIPQFELKDMKAPGCTELNVARRDATKYLQVFRHCQHCRADACGIPGSGEDLGEHLYDKSISNFSHG